MADYKGIKKQKPLAFVVKNINTTGIMWLFNRSAEPDHIKSHLANVPEFIIYNMCLASQCPITTKIEQVFI